MHWFSFWPEVYRIAVRFLSRVSCVAGEPRSIVVYSLVDAAALHIGKNIVGQLSHTFTTRPIILTMGACGNVVRCDKKKVVLFFEIYVCIYIYIYM